MDAAIQTFRDRAEKLYAAVLSAHKGAIRENASRSQKENSFQNNWAHLTEILGGIRHHIAYSEYKGDDRDELFDLLGKEVDTYIQRFQKEAGIVRILQPKDLRVGNYINDRGKAVRVELWILQEISANNKDYTPIELTPDLLVKCGFVDLSEPAHSHNRFILNRKINDHCIQHYEVHDLDTFVLKNYYRHLIEEAEPDEYVCQIDLLYLHQLQNLYFALTGEELTINL